MCLVYIWKGVQRHQDQMAAELDNLAADDRQGGKHFVGFNDDRFSL